MGGLAVGMLAGGTNCCAWAGIEKRHAAKCRRQNTKRRPAQRAARAQVWRDGRLGRRGVVLDLLPKIRMASLPSEKFAICVPRAPSVSFRCVDEHLHGQWHLARPGAQVTVVARWPQGQARPTITTNGATKIRGIIRVACAVGQRRIRRDSTPRNHMGMKHLREAIAEQSVLVATSQQRIYAWAACRG